jgi:outer membrane protein OmpA-like peptidoglycan-associated protein
LRKRRRRRNIILATTATVFVLAVAGVALSIFGMPSINVSGGKSAALSVDRFAGIGTISIPDGPEEQMWWSATSRGEVTDVPGSVFAESGEYTRTRIPADLLFAADSATLSDAAKKSIKKIAENLADVDANIFVVCHSSSDGPVAQRKTISLRRANALATELESLMNRPRNSIERIGRGDKDPISKVDPNSSAGKVLNRRCEIYVQN